MLQQFRPPDTFFMLSSGTKIPSWVLNPGGSSPASLDLNFVTNQGYLQGVGSRSAASFLTVSRASTGYASDTSGNWYSFANNVARITNQGLLVEESRTNSIRNNLGNGTTTGAVVGTIRTNPSITTLSRTASATAVIATSATNGATVGDTITISGANVASYNGVFAVSAVNPNVSISYLTTVNTTDAATGASVTQLQSPGTLPTNWAQNNSTGLVLTVVNIGTDTNGIAFVDLQLAGVPTGAGNNNLLLETINQIAAAYGQTWTWSSFYKTVSGNFTNLSAVRLTIAGTNGASNTETFTGTSLSASSTWARTTQSVTFALSTTTNVCPQWQLNPSSASAATFVVFRIGWPQLEKNPNINATLASATVATGGTGYNNGDTGTISGGTFATQSTYTVLTSTAGVVNTVSVSAGSYTALPASPASTAVTTGGGDGTLTLNLTPTNLAADGFATSPIPTTTVAVTRAADNIKLNQSISFGNSISLYASIVPEGIAPPAILQRALAVNDNTLNNRFEVTVQNGNNRPAWILESGGSQAFSTNYTGTAIAAGSLSKLAISGKPGTQLASLNNTSGSGQTAASMPVSPFQLQIGNFLGGNVNSATYERASVWATTALSQAQLNTITSGTGP